MQNDKSDETRRPKPPFNHLRSLLETPESRKPVYLFTDMETSKMEKMVRSEQQDSTKG